MAGAFVGQSVAVELRREGYRASGCLSWIATSRYGIVAGQAGDFLHAEEWAAFKALKAEKRQISYLLGRYTAKAALGECVGPGFNASQALIASGIFSQPVVQCPQALRPVGVSISHSDRLVCTLAYPEEHPMAIDVEEIDESRTKVMLTQIGHDEADLARSVCASVDVAATVVWTAKEALSKALRCGMTCPYGLLEICGLETRNGIYTGRFKNFAQYKFESWQRGSSVLTIVLPKRTEMGVSFPHTL